MCLVWTGIVLCWMLINMTHAAWTAEAYMHKSVCRASSVCIPKRYRHCCVCKHYSSQYTAQPRFPLHSYLTITPPSSSLPPPDPDILVGLLRLRKCSKDTFRSELKGGVSIVRELHVYPPVEGCGCVWDV